MPEVETPHLNAMVLSWVSLRVVGILSAIHGRFVGFHGMIIKVVMNAVEYATRLRFHRKAALEERGVHFANTNETTTLNFKKRGHSLLI